VTRLIMTRVHRPTSLLHRIHWMTSLWMLKYCQIQLPSLWRTFRRLIIIFLCISKFGVFFTFQHNIWILIRHCHCVLKNFLIIASKTTLYNIYIWFYSTSGVQFKYKNKCKLGTFDTNHTAYSSLPEWLPTSVEWSFARRNWSLAISP